MPSSEAIVIVGASARAAAFSAARAGMRPWAADLFGDGDLGRLCPSTRVARYPDDFVTAVGAAPAGPWMYTGGLENFPRIVERIAAERPLYGNRGAVLRGVRDPSKLRRVAAGVGLPFPRTVDSADDLPRDGTWLRKGRRSSGGLRIESWDESLRAAAVTRGYYFQQRIAGAAYGATFVGAGGTARLLGVARQFTGGDHGIGDLAGARPFHYAGSIGPVALGPAVGQSLEQFGHTLADKFGLAGLFGVDFILSQGSLWPIEVNPRYPSSVEILERTSGWSAVGLHAAACRNLVLPDANSITAPDRVSGKAILFAVEPLVLDERAWAVLDEESRRKPPMLADLPAGPAAFSAGSPLATLFADGPNLADVEADLGGRIAAFRRELETSALRSATSVP